MKNIELLDILKIESKRDTNSNRNKQIKLNYQHLNNLEKMNPKDYYLLINEWDSWEYLNNPKKMYDKVYNGILKSINHLKKLNLIASNVLEQKVRIILKVINDVKDKC